MTPGDTLGRYEIKEPLGAGGMGEVYRARDPRLDRDVAIKVLPQEFAEDADRLRRFEREAKTVAALDHPNIVTIYSVEEADGVHFLTMQLVEGQPLARVIPSGGMTLEAFLELAVPLADALAAAHAQGVTHRDIKPGNVLIDRSERPKVLDFGLAKVVEPAQPGAGDSEELTIAAISEEPLTGEGTVLGTVDYMSPEQAEGKPVDHRSDIFSLGIVFYEMLTGVRPFRGETRVSVVSLIIKDEPLAVTEINDGFPWPLGRIIKRCLEKKSIRRFQSAIGLRNELEDLKHELESGELHPARDWQEAVSAASRGAAAGAGWRSPDTVGAARLSPDDRYLYITRETAESDVWLLSLRR